MSFQFDPDANALYLRLRVGRVAETVELAHFVNLDVDDGGEPLGLEFVDADDFLPSLRRHAGHDLPVELPRDIGRLATALAGATATGDRG